MRQFNSDSRLHSPAPAAGPDRPRQLQRLSRAVSDIARRLVAPPVPAARSAVSEPLEQRRLLATFFGGETFTFEVFDQNTVDEDGTFETITVRMHVLGGSDTQIELVGANFSGLGDFSGFLDSADPDRAGPVRGGVEGAIGAQPLVPDDLTFISEEGDEHRFNLSDYVGSPFGDPLALAPQSAVAFDRMFTTPDGSVYGMELNDIDVFGTTVRILEAAEFNTDVDDTGEPGNPEGRQAGSGSTDLDTRTNVADALFRDNLMGEVVNALTSYGGRFLVPSGDDPAEQTENVQDIIGVSAGTDGRIYLGLTVTTLRAEDDSPGADFEDTDVPVILSFDPAGLTGGSYGMQVEGSDFFGDNLGDDAELVAELSNFTVGDVDGDGSHEYILIGTFNERLRAGTGAETLQSTTGMIVLDDLPDSDRVDRENVDPISFVGEDELAISDITVRPPTEPGEAGTIFGLSEPGEEAFLFTLDTEGNADRLGGVAVNGSGAGASLAGLTWDPNFDNPFTGEQGAFFSYSTAADQLLVLDQRPRGVASALSVYNITVLNSDASSGVIAYELDEDGNPVPFAGNPAPVGGTGDDLIELQDGTGRLYLGLKRVFEDPGFVEVFGGFDPDEVSEGTSPFAGITYNGLVRPGLYVLDGDFGRFLWGGAVTGNVLVQGSMDTFYAGALLTGDAGDGITSIDNFAVYGDMRNVIINSQIGFAQNDDEDNPQTLVTGADFAIGGRLNSIRTSQTFYAGLDVRNDRPGDDFDPDATFFTQMTGAFSEMEEAWNVDDPNAQGNAFAAGNIALPFLLNESFQSYEPLGALGDGTITVSGAVQGSQGPNGIDDFSDFYGTGIMAGTRFTVEIVDGSHGVIVYDPEGRRVASNFENNELSATAVAGSEFTVVAETAGVYRFEVVGGGAYQMILRGVGDIGIGGVKAEGNVVLSNSVGDGAGVRLFQGDIGSIQSRFGSTFGLQTLRTLAGNIRAVWGHSAGRGFETDDDFSVAQDSVSIRAAHSVGRIEGTNEGNNETGGFAFVNFGGVRDAEGFIDPMEVIGDDIQMVRASRDVAGVFAVGRGIGSIVAGRDFGSSGAPQGAIYANTDDINNDGFVDMVSIGRLFGGAYDTRLNAYRDYGGVAIDVGSSGNFRYLDIPTPANGVNGVAGVFRDRFFGGSFGGPEEFINVEPGEDYTFVDDSGTVTTLSANDRRMERVDPNNPDATPEGQGTLQVLTYPVRSGGVVAATVNSNRSLTVTSSDRSRRASVEIGNVRLSGEGRPVINASDPNFPGGGDPELVLAGSFFDPADPLDDDDEFDDIEVILNGGRVDIFSIDATNTDAQGGKITRIENNSRGEVLDLTASSVGFISGKFIGVGNPRGFGQIEANQDRIRDNDTFSEPSFYPFDQPRHLIGVEGDIIEIRGEVIGNIFAGLPLGFNNHDTGGNGGGGGGGGGDDGGFGGGDGGFGGGGILQSPEGNAGGTGNLSGLNGFDDRPQRIGQFGDGIGGSGTGGTGVGGLGEIVEGESRGRIGTVIANADGINEEGLFEGIVRPVVAATPDDTGDYRGEIHLVQIGEGIADDGGGIAAGGGVYAEGYILEVRGSGQGHDIRGDIIASEINAVILDGGSIVGADILSGVDPTVFTEDDDDPFSYPSWFFTPAADILGSRISDEVIEPNDREPQYEIDLIRVTGGGGILNAEIFAPDIDTIQVSGGFGMLQMLAEVTDRGTLNLVTTDGLGIRNSILGRGEDVNQIIAAGDGELLNLRDYSPSVDFSGAGREFDPFSGQRLNSSNDLRLALGLPTDIDPRRRRITNSGVIENIQAFGSGDLGRMDAFVIRNNMTNVTPPPVFEEDAAGIGQADPSNETFTSLIDFGRRIGQINAHSTYGFRVVAGELGTFALTEDMLNTFVRISGEIDRVVVSDLFREDSTLRADGPDGVLNYIEAHDLLGFVSGDTGIGTIRANNDLGGNLGDPAVALSTPANKRSLEEIGTIIVGNDILTGAYVRATDEIGRLTVGGDIQEGAVVQAREINDLDVEGNIFGDIVVVG